MVDSNISDNLADMVPFPRHLGVQIISATPDLVVGEIEVRPELCTVGDTLHGGAIMAFADTLGAIGGVLNLPDGASGTTTSESKTNFLAPPPLGTIVRGESIPIHIGRRLSVWQTRLIRADGKLAALITQTQMVL